MSEYPKAVANGWFPVAALRELGAKPLARMLMDRRLVVFQGRDGAGVLIDRCPHRNVALSGGRVMDGQIECPYHGWRFARDGRCMLTPGAEQPARFAAESLPAETHAGLVWTTLAAEPAPFPQLPDPVGRDGYDSFLWPVPTSRAALIDAVENLLDPAHPHFLHAGIVRSRTVRKPVEVTVRTGPGLAEAIYVENARATALMPRLLEGLRTTSIGRFFPPSIGQLAFEGPKGLRLAITVFFVPESVNCVRPFAHFATPKGTAPAFVKEAFLRAFHIPVLAQDRAMLRAQTDNVEAFGAPRYALGPLDFLRLAIQQLANGETPPVRETTATVQL